MVNTPLQTILIVGNRTTGKTTYIQRIMGIDFYDIVDSRRRAFRNSVAPEPDPVCLHYLPIPDSHDVVRVIELNHVSPIPPEYVDLIDKIIVFASFDNEYSIHDITFHANTYGFLDVPIHVVINKKDLLQNASPNIVNAVLATATLQSIHLISCKTDGNLLNCLTHDDGDA
jgi:signal recognition particle receptor subunit beta